MRQFAVVTGASTGIGYHLAEQFAKNGFDLLICAENAEIFSAQGKLKALGAEVVAEKVNLAHYKGVEQLYSKIKSLNRPVDAIALNAGIGVNGDFARETDLSEELHLIQLNVASTVHLAKRVLKDMVARNSGKILFTSSVVSMMPSPFEAIYAASKAFVQSFAQGIRNELKDTEITITSLMPGATETEFFHRAGMDDTEVGKQKKDEPSLVAEQGFKALMAGKDHVVGGSFMNRVQTTIAKVLPQAATAQISRGKSEPESDKERDKKKSA
jgi:short-subunit dehydrogenase